MGLEMETPQSQAEQRAEAVSRLKLLPVPSQVQEQVRRMQKIISQDTQVSGMLARGVVVQQTCILLLQVIFKQMLQMKCIFSGT